MPIDYGDLVVLYFHDGSKEAVITELVGWLLEDGFLTVGGKQIQFGANKSFLSKYITHPLGMRNDQMGDIL